MNKIAIIVGSTRPGRVGDEVAQWVLEKASARSNDYYEIVDIQDFNLPLYDEVNFPATQVYEHEHTRRWSEKIASFDAFIIVTPEYNHAPPAALKNAFDFLYAEWNNKAAGFVGYGALGAVRAIAQLRQVMAQLEIADVGTAVTFIFNVDFIDYPTFKPADFHEEELDEMLAKLLAWSTALKELRNKPV